MEGNRSKHIIKIFGLNPETAGEMGYEWWKDVIYDAEAPQGAMEDVFDLNDMGYVFGESASSGDENNFVGVYVKKKPAV